MENNIENEEISSLKKIISKYALLLIIIGFAARIFMLFYYYYTHTIDPQKSWGDVGNYFVVNLTNTPLTVVFLIFFRFLSFGKIEIFVFWCFFWDILTCIVFYFVLKSFNLKNRNYIYGLFMINPFYFLVNTFSINNCGYHITDAMFLFFLMLAFVYFPKKELYARYLFYFFLGLSMCIKYFTIPAIALFFLKYLFEKNWKELKIFTICIAPLTIIFLIVPFIYIDWFRDSLFRWSSFGNNIPIYIKIIPMLCVLLIFMIFRIKKSDRFEISIVAIVAAAAFMVMSVPYLRWFQAVLFYGILKEKDFTFNLGNKKLTIDNHIITFCLSIVGVIFSYIFILYVH